MAIAALLVAATGYAQCGADDANACYEQPCDSYCCPESCGRFLFGAEVLYLRAFQGGLSSVCDETSINDTTENGRVISRLKGKGREPDFDWNAGFRIGAGYGFACSPCEIGVIWTNFNSNSHSHGHCHRNNLRWNLDYNTVDVLFSCQCDCSCIELSPFAGVRYARIDQKLHSNFVSYNNGSITHSHGSAKNDFSGVGPLLGIEGEWGFGCGWSLYGDVAFGVLYGKFRNHSHSFDEFDTGTNINFLRNHTESCQSFLDTGFGVRWKTCLCNRVVVMQLGVETTRYFNQNQFCGYGDLSLDGVNFGIGTQF